MTKFILHGGYTQTPNHLNAEFYKEIAEGLQDGANVLLVYFSRDKDEWEKLAAQDMKKIRDASSKTLQFIVASKENFVSQVKLADVIYLRGGDTDQLLRVLRKFPTIRDLFSRKTIAGSSAGAYALAKYYYTYESNKVEQGLGLMPIAVIAHFDGDKSVLEKLSGSAAGLEVVALRDFEFKVIERSE